MLYNVVVVSAIYQCQTVIIIYIYNKNIYIYIYIYKYLYIYKTNINSSIIAEEIKFVLKILLKKITLGPKVQILHQQNIFK